MTAKTIWPAVAVLILSAPVIAQCQYSVQLTPPWQCSQSWSWYYTGTGLNDLGGWCGWRPQCYPGIGDVAVYCPPGGTPQALPIPPGAGPYGAQATAVNDAGVVVGFYYQGPNLGPEIGCVWWPDGTITTIAPGPGATNSRANGVNNAGVVTGQTGNKPYVWANGITTAIDPSPLPNGHGRAISDTGWIAGYGGDLTGTDGRAFRWRDGLLEVLPPLNGNQTSQMLGLNNAGEVVGISRRFVTGTGYISEPCIWRHGKHELLALPSGYTDGWAMNINDSGVIVGRAYASSGSGLPNLHAVWTGGDMFALAGLVPPGSPSISLPRAINANGTVLTQGGAQLLTPLGQSFADLNGDCAVNGADLMLVLTEWGPRAVSIADLDGSGFVDGADLAMVLGNWTGTR